MPTKSKAPRASPAGPSSSTKRTPISKESSSKHHKRSRTGCFTCRVRRKKCDEEQPICRACHHLGITCEYRRPGWWSDAENRRKQMEVIKDTVSRNSKMQDRTAKQPPTLTSATPSLTNSMPTPDTYSEAPSTLRGVPFEPYAAPNADLGTPHSQDFFNTPLVNTTQWTPVVPQSAQFGHMPQFSSFYPYEVDIRTEQQLFVNDIPIRKDSMLSMQHNFPVPPGSALQPVFPHNEQEPESGFETQQYFESYTEEFDEPLPSGSLFQFPHEILQPTEQAVIEVPDEDRELLDHFLRTLAPRLFPILEVSQQGSALSDVILPLMSKSYYLHACLCTAAEHLKGLEFPPQTESADQIAEDARKKKLDEDIVRHRGALVEELCKDFSNPTEQYKVLESTLAAILFQSSVAVPKDEFAQLPWHTHFGAVTILMEEIKVACSSSTHLMDDVTHNFIATLTGWIDILGSPMQHRCPIFAHSYRSKSENGITSGFAQLMGCNDTVMYLIAEIASLDYLKDAPESKMDDMTLCNYIQGLGYRLTATQASPGECASVYSEVTGAIDPEQLSRNITAVFRLAARLYLCSLVPDFSITEPRITALVEQLTDAMEFIPGGSDGYDKSVVWPLLMAGVASTPGSNFREMLAKRCEALGEDATFGTIGNLRELLSAVWDVNDTPRPGEEPKFIHWRDIMQSRNWDFLLL